MTTLEKAADVVINTCIGLKENERILILYDDSTKKIADALNKTAKQKSVYVTLIELKNRPILKFPEDINKELCSSDICIYLADSFFGELDSFRRPLRKYAHEKEIRFVTMPKITEKIFIDSLAVDYESIWEFTKKVYQKLSCSKQIQVKTDKGTDLTADFSEKIKWVISDGDFRAFHKDKMNLPGAEVFTCPSFIEGTFIIDGLLGDFFTKKYLSLDKTPLYITIKNSRIAKVECENKVLLEEFNRHTFADENSSRVGEFALGTNIFLKEFYNHFLVDEKFPGFHLAFGNPYPERTNADWKSKIHLDCLIREPTVILDSKEKILIKGKYML